MDALAFISGIGPTETLVILAVALLVFGGKLPDVAKSLGRSLNEFRKGMRDLSSEIDRDVYEPIRREIPKLDSPFHETVPASSTAQDDSDPAEPTSDASTSQPANAFEGESNPVDAPPADGADPSLLPREEAMESDSKDKDVPPSEGLQSSDPKS